MTYPTSYLKTLGVARLGGCNGARQWSVPRAARHRWAVDGAVPALVFHWERDRWWFPERRTYQDRRQDTTGREQRGAHPLAVR